MTAKVARQTVPLPDWAAEHASDEDKQEINQMVKDFLDGFEADYRHQIDERNKK